VREQGRHQMLPDKATAACNERFSHEDRPKIASLTGHQPDNTMQTIFAKARRDRAGTQVQQKALRTGT
jgi:hypothetical protein